MIADRRIWRTVDGALVDEGDERAAFLVVGEGCDVPAEFEDAVKALAQPANKKAAQPANKKA